MSIGRSGRPNISPCNGHRVSGMLQTGQAENQVGKVVHRDPSQIALSLAETTT